MDSEAIPSRPHVPTSYSGTGPEPTTDHYPDDEGDPPKKSGPLTGTGNRFTTTA